MGHKLDDDRLLTQATFTRMHDEAVIMSGKPQWFACFLLKSGAEMSRCHIMAPVADPISQVFAFDMLKGLNNHLHHDGAWVCCMADPNIHAHGLNTNEAMYKNFIFLWMDNDGDIQCPVWIEDDLVDILAKGPDYWIEQCEDAWLHTQELTRSLELRPCETFKRALGEKAPSLQ